MVTEAELMADLRATFPGLWMRPLREFGKQWKGCAGIWTGGDTVMPDGLQIFSSLECDDPDVYNGRVHHAFEAWVEQRGWYVEDYDGATFFIVEGGG